MSTCIFVSYYCCCCGFGPQGLELHSVCISCGHVACENCERHTSSHSLKSADAPSKEPSAYQHGGRTKACFDIILGAGSLGSSFLLNQYNEYLEHSSVNYWEMGEGTLSTQSIRPARFSSGTGDLLGPRESGASPVDLVHCAAVLFRCAPLVSLAGPVSCAAFTTAATAFYHRHRNDRYQDHFLLFGMACGIFLGLGIGQNLQGTVLSVMPCLISLSLALSSAMHRVMRWPQKKVEEV